MSDTLEAGRSSAAVMGDAENGNIDRNGASPQSNAAGDDSGFLEERDAPWPATFERSISLLSSPIISTPQADLFTRSPKPGGTPLTGRRAQVSEKYILFSAS